MANDTDIFGNTAAPQARGDSDIFIDVPKRREGPPLATLGPEGFRKSMQEAIAGDVFPQGAAAVAGAGTLIDQPALRLKQFFSGLSPQENQQVQANRALLSNPYAIGGAVMGSLPVAAPQLLTNIGLGALQGALQPTQGDESAVGNTVRGGLFGAGANMLGRVATGAVTEASDAAKRLMREGVIPTIGQAAQSGTGAINKLVGKAEEWATSIPGVGSFIENSRRRALGEANEAALNRAMPAGERVTDIGNEGLAQAKGALGGAYDRVYAGVNNVLPDQQMGALVAAAKGRPLVPMSDAAEAKFDATVKRLLWDRWPVTNAQEAGTIKQTIEADLGKAAREAASGPTATSDDRALSVALTAVRDAVRDRLNRAVGPNSAELPQLNRAYANYVQIRDATERAKANGGIFTPFQLQSTSSGPLRELANDAQAVLANRVPNSGTPERLMASALATGQVPQRDLPYLLGILSGAPVLYSRPIQGWMQGAYLPWLQQGMPAASAGILGGLNAMSQQ